MKRIEQFDGKRIVGVAVDDNTVSVDDVRESFADVRIDEFVVKTNDSILGEGTTFLDMLDLLPQSGNNITLYAHAKGTRYNPKKIGTIQKWADILYQTNLDNKQLIDLLIHEYPVVGSMKRYGDHNKEGSSRWYYSGSFFWFRNHDVFLKPNWRELIRFYGCVECWPSCLFKSGEAACVVGNDAGILYKPAPIAEVYKEWKFISQIKPSTIDEFNAIKRYWLGQSVVNPWLAKPIKTHKVEPYKCKPVDVNDLNCPIDVNLGRGLGIVMPGGGIYMRAAWVSVRMIRYFGCDLPIELWLLPWEEATAAEESAFNAYGVTIRRASPGFCLDETVETTAWGPIWLAGWQLKVQAVLQSTFNQVICFDADCYPVEIGWVEKLTQCPTFMADVVESDYLLSKEACDTIGVKREVPVDAGVFYTIKQNEWCNTVGALNGPEHVRDIYSLFYGDKDTWWVSHRLAGVDFRILWHGKLLPGSNSIRHQIGVLHRAGCKYTDGLPRNTPQCSNRQLECDNLTEQFLKSWPPLLVRNKRDADLMSGVLEMDEYRLRQMSQKQYIVDAGAHIGSFSYAVIKRWPSARILAVEPDRDNCRLFRINIPSAELVEGALSDRHGSVSLFSDGDDTAYHTMVGGDIATYLLSEEVSGRNWPRIDLLKIDVEGDEDKIFKELVASGWIKKVGMIVGEWHTTDILSQVIELLRPTHHMTINCHWWDHGYFEAIRNDR